MNHSIYIAFTLCFGLFVAACAKGADAPLVTDKDLAALRSSLNTAASNMSPDEIAALNWALSDLSFDTIQQRYPAGTAREMIHGEAMQIIASTPTKIAALEEAQRVAEPVVAELRKISATEVRFALERDFFGLQPKISAEVTNASAYPVSGLKWFAALYIDDGEQPVATAELFDGYNESRHAGAQRDGGGLLPGERAARTMHVGFVSGERTWTTLEIQKARTLRVRLTVIPQTVLDLGERSYVGSDPAPQLGQLREQLATARRYSSL